MTFSAKFKANSFAEAAEKADAAGNPPIISKLLRELGGVAPHLGPHESEIDEKQIAVEISGHSAADAFEISLSARFVPGPKFPKPAKVEAKA